jgi:two-component system OmpR family response regulator
MGYILIAEDDAHIRLLIQRKLETAGYKVRTTPNGSEALKMALDDPPRMVLLDIMLPGMDGLEVCQAIKTELAAKAPYVIIISARGSEDDVRAGEAAGADDYLIKPFSPHDLLEHVEALLDR